MPTVAVNGLTLSHKGSGGFEKCTAPDVCKTPPYATPVPYQIVSFNSGQQKGSKTVKADGGNTIDIKPSIHIPCTGDEPGSIGGVVSGVIKHESSWITFSPNVKIEGQNACRLSDKMFMNKKNTISGTGGNWEPNLPPGTDPVIEELCKIFCKINNDGRKGKDRRARKAAEKSRGLRQAARRKFGRNAVPDMNRSIFHPFKKKGVNIASRAPGGAGRARVDYARNLGKLENKLKNRFLRSARNKILWKAAKSQGKKIFLKAVPVVGWLSAGYDAYTILNDLSAAKKAWDNMKGGVMGELRKKAAQGFKIFEVKPDVVIDNGGKVDAIYDFKFGTDKWGADQKTLYDDVLAQGKAKNPKSIAIGQNSKNGQVGCNCRKR